MWGGRFRPPRSLTASQGLRNDASIVPYEAQGKVLPGFTGYFRRKAAMHPFICALRRIHLPLQGRLWENCRPEGSPVRGAGGVSRLRGAAPGLANTLPGSADPPGGRERPPYNAGQTGGGAGNKIWRWVPGRCKHRPLRKGGAACIAYRFWQGIPNGL